MLKNAVALICNLSIASHDGHVGAKAHIYRKPLFSDKQAIRLPTSGIVVIREVLV